MKKIVIIGASGHGKVVADIALRCGYDEIAFLDDNESVKTCGKWDCIGKTDMASQLNDDLFIAIGNADVRKAFFDRLKDKKIVSLVHPQTVIANSVKIGRGTVIMAGAVINPDAEIGEGCIINTCSSVDHDCRIRDFVHISVGAHISGTVEIGEFTWVGAGATVSNNINICGNCVLGAGAVVVKDISESGTYIGVPAKVINKM
ncbi:MAG: acetyltransferase [Clostridia bacterium]|nr:acetyltransferase [Clostridia bacterium]